MTVHHLGVAVGAAAASLGVGRADGEGGGAVLDGLLPLAELGLAGGPVAEQHRVVLLLLQPFPVGGAGLPVLARLEQLVPPAPRRRHRPRPPHRHPGVLAPRFQSGRSLRRRHGLLEPFTTSLPTL